MNVMFAVHGKRVFLADREKMIIGIDNGSAYEYYDIKGNRIPAEVGFDHPDAFDVENDDPWESSWIQNEGIEDKLVSESTSEIKWEIDDGFGNFGFKNQAGDFVIEPQYAYAHEFTCGLAAVNLNRTWYRTKEGQRFYENHYGFINELGETVIPFAYDEAKPFNKYGVAVVSDRKHIYLIDTEGNVIPGTEGMLFSEYYEYDNRFLEFQYPGDDDNEMNISGIYDTKERSILLRPSIDSFTEYSEEEIFVGKWCGNNEFGFPEYSRYFINSKGELLYPWLVGKGFGLIRQPNKSLLSMVAVYDYSISPIGFSQNGKKYSRELQFGVYSSKEQYVVPAEYEKIYELSDRIFGCVKEGIITVVQVEDYEI